MKISRKLRHRYLSRGTTTVLAVIAATILISGLLTFSLRVGINSIDAQSDAQMRQDVRYREEAFLSALLHIVPNRAILAMKAGSSVDAMSWEVIFADALEISDSRAVVDSEFLDTLGVEGISAQLQGENIFEIGTPGLEGGPVIPGNSSSMGLLASLGLGDSLPPPLEVPSDLLSADISIPLLSKRKVYSPLYESGLYADPALYPSMNLIRYPNLRFGYSPPGSLVVAKRNWWVFSTRSRVDPVGDTMREKYYLLSIYELPSQIPISSTGVLTLGRHEDGSFWDESSISLDGSIYGAGVKNMGRISTSGGSITARNSLFLGAQTMVAGSSLSDGFDDLGAREARDALSTDDFYGASLSGNGGGEAVFLNINPGTNFLYSLPDEDSSLRASPTGWEEYSRGANRCAITIRVTKIDAESQIPIEVELDYLTTSGGSNRVVLERGTNWPTGSGVEGEPNVPVDTEILDNLRSTLVVLPENLEDYLGSLPDAAPLSENHSILVEYSSSMEGFNEPTIPSEADQMAVAIRRCEDLTSFDKGFALVTPFPVYFLENFNQVPAETPAGSGIDPASPYFPPTAVFSPEKRFGGQLNSPTPVHLDGRVSVMTTDVGQEVSPLSLKGADDEEIGSDIITANLKSAVSPASIAPIHELNWLVTVEEIEW
jgi:hypothetical protein